MPIKESVLHKLKLKHAYIDHKFTKNYKNFLYSSSLAKDVHSSTVNLASFLGSYFLNKTSNCSQQGTGSSCFRGTAKHSFIIALNSSNFMIPSLSASWSVKISNMYQ